MCGLRPLTWLLLLVSACCAATLPVNCIVPDGWFWTKDAAFRAPGPGSDNFAPIGVPAYAYWAVERALGVLGVRTVEATLYAASIVHHGALFGAGLGIAASGRVIGCPRAAGVAAAVFVLVIESTGIPQTAIAENFLIPLDVWAVYSALRVYVALTDTGRAPARWAITGGTLLGLAAGIEPTVLVVLPAALALFWTARRRFRARTDTRAARGVGAQFTAGVLLVVLGSMGTNVLRFERFELTSATGRHLWNTARLAPEAVLGATSEFGELLASIPIERLGQMRFWELQSAMVDSASDELRRYAENPLEFDRFLQRMVTSGVTSDPLAFFGVGVRQFAAHLLDPPVPVAPGLAQLGFRAENIGDEWLNPLGRSDWLPPVIGMGGARVDRLLDRARWSFEDVFALLLTAIVLGAIGLGVLVRISGTSTKAQRDCRATVRMAVPVHAFLLWCFLANRYATCQVEVFTGRYVVTFLSALLLCGASVLSLYLAIARTSVSGAATRALGLVRPRP